MNGNVNFPKETLMVEELQSATWLIYVKRRIISSSSDLEGFDTLQDV